jgi:hypothetical protein
MAHGKEQRVPWILHLKLTNFHQCQLILKDITTEEINYWLSRFALEVRKKDGSEYRHEVIYSLFCSMNRVIRENHPEVSLLH